MTYSGDLLKINNTTIPHIVSYKVTRAKLWKDAERNMNGDIRATLIGVFPKIIVQIGVCTQNELSTLTQLLDQPYFTVTYFDSRIGGTTSARYYASDYDTEILDKTRGLYKPFEVSLVPVSKRRY